LNRYPTLKNIFNSYINQGYYENIAIEYVSGATPTAYFYDENQVEIDAAILGDISIEELKDLLASHGFELRRPTLPAPILTSELTDGKIHYQYFGSGKLYQNFAKEFAESLTNNGQQGRLLTLRCKAQEEKIDTWIKQFNPEAVIWLGAYDRESEGYWKWSNGELFWTANTDQNTESIYSNWRPGEPNNADMNEHCATYKPSTGWNDVNCESAAEIIVEFGPVTSGHCENEPVLSSIHSNSHVDHEEVNL